VSEADTCRKYVVPKLQSAGWDDDQILEQKSFTDGRIIVVEDKSWRGKQKRADYLLYYRRNFPLAVVEAKASYKKAADGLQQAKDYAEILGLKFAYATNGKEIIEHDYFTGKETKMGDFPIKEELWSRYLIGDGIDSLTDEDLERYLAPFRRVPAKPSRYYQEIAVNWVIKAILSGQRRVLITMATGTGKTLVAFHIIWKLWESRWNRKGDYRRPKILFLADRDVLVSDPMTKDFAVFGDAAHRIAGEAIKSREVYFATYQAIARDELRPGLYREYDPSFFDLIVVDECHRGSARDDSNWREILQYFEPAYQLGMTATPKRDENVDTYYYFGNPVYQYSLKQGIEDGFLSPYRVHRVVSSLDATGYRPSKGELDRTGRLIPDKEYTTRDFERTLVVDDRTQVVAHHLTAFLKENDRFAKTIVFCVDQDHAATMRIALNNLNTDIVKEHPNYVCRITSAEGDVGKRHLDSFMDVEGDFPVLVTTSKLLSTGVDVPTCKNIVIFRVVNSMVEFKQIIGRGTRIRDDYGKDHFDIIDYTGSATRKFADPEFDGWPAEITEIEIDEYGRKLRKRQLDKKSAVDQGDVSGDPHERRPVEVEPSEGGQKLYVNKVMVEIVADVVYELDSEGNRLNVIKYTDYSGEQVRSMFTSAADLRSKWSDEDEREAILDTLEERGVSLKDLVEKSKMPEADPFDLLCHFAFSSPIRTRRERADRIKREEKEFLDKFVGEARDILDEIMNKYIEYGVEQIDVNILKVPPISSRGNIMEISQFFGGPEQLRSMLVDFQSLLYAS